MDLLPLKPKANPNAAPDPNDPIFFCESCNSKYLDKTKFREHLHGVHKMNLSVLRSKPNSDIEPDPNDSNFYYKSCNTNHLNSRKFRRHLKSVHPWICDN